MDETYRIDEPLHPQMKSWAMLSLLLAAFSLQDEDVGWLVFLSTAAVCVLALALWGSKRLVIDERGVRITRFGWVLQEISWREAAMAVLFTGAVRDRWGAPHWKTYLVISREEWQSVAAKTPRLLQWGRLPGAAAIAHTEERQRAVEHHWGKPLMRSTSPLRTRKSKSTYDHE